MYATRAICGAIGTIESLHVNELDSFCSGVVNTYRACCEQLVGGRGFRY